MMRFFKKALGHLVLTGLAASFILAGGANVHAISFVGAANIDTTTAGATSVGAAGNGINIISGNASGGNQFINSTSTNVFGSAGNIRVVGSNLLASYILQDGGLIPILYNGTQVAAVFALEGTVAGLGPTIFAATGGRVGLFTAGLGYNLFNPLTWGGTDATGNTLLTPIAVWDLKPAEPVVDNPANGGPGIFNLAPNQVNQISVNASVGTSNQGFFLFRETQNAIFSGPGALSGNGFITVVSNPLPPSFAFEDEGLVSRVDESYRIATGGTGGNTSFISGGPGTPGFNALNTIACQLASLSDLDAAILGCQGFANAFGTIGNSAGDGRSFNPSNGNPIPNTADLLFTLGATASPTVQGTTIPEPASIILFIFGGLAACRIVGLRRFL